MDICDDECFLPDGKTDIKAREGQAIDTVRISLVGGAGIVGQNTDGGFALICREQGKQVGRKVHLQQKVCGGVRKTAGGLRVAIGIGNRDGNDGISCRFLYYLLYFYNPLVERLNIRAVSFWYFSLRRGVSFQIVGY